MKTFLPLISLLLLFTDAYAAPLKKGPVFNFTNGEKVEYGIILQFRDVQITGLCIMKLTEGNVAGSVINEFGIKAFDFVYLKDKNKIILSNMIKYLDKWYIRSVIRRDWLFLMNAGTEEGKRVVRRRELLLTEEGNIELKNNKHKLSYTFNPLIKTESDEVVK
jgi:hypothetical protein